jgi:prepilin-type N-terminal cleavage/methylation domain-containing protein/prepilin-type processing-associated H-X9-DG protein
MPTGKRQRRDGFSLIEILVVIGLIAILLALLLPAIHKARMQADAVACRSNLQQIGQSLLIYANNNQGWIYPPNAGAIPGRPKEEYWPNLVFKPAVWNPPILRCPVDREPALECSYLLNHYLRAREIRYHGSNLGNRSTSAVIVMGEKRSEMEGYYLDPGEYDLAVEPFRHGSQLKSNYLYLDLHVDNEAATGVVDGVEPWDVPPPAAGAGAS